MNQPDVAELRPRSIDPQPPVPHGMRTFTVYRSSDESGVSGTGIIIQGCLFANGKCCIQWLCNPEPGDTQIKEWEAFLTVHVKSHPTNRTIITFDNDEQLIFAPENPTED